MTTIEKFGDWATMHIIPLVYDDSLSFLEMLGAMKAKINEVIDNDTAMNAQLVQFSAWVDTQLADYATNTIDTMLTNGELAALINSTLWDTFHAEIDAQIALLEGEVNDANAANTAAISAANTANQTLVTEANATNAA